jgi:hypothetical protein
VTSLGESHRLLEVLAQINAAPQFQVTQAPYVPLGRCSSTASPTSIKSFNRRGVMSGFISRRFSSIAVGGIAALSTGLLALAMTSAADHEAHATSPSLPPVSQHFQALRGAPSGPLSENPFVGQANVDPTSARRLEVPGRNIWAVTSADEVCISATSQIDPAVVGGACADASIVAQDGLLAGLDPSPADVKTRNLAPDTTEITMLVPDGVLSVELALPGGARRVVAVASNIAATTLASRPSSARFVDSAGATRTIRFQGAS